MELLKIVKRHTPWQIRNFTRRVKRELNWALNARRSVDTVFHNVYVTKQWGEDTGDFHSGPGSTGVMASVYAESIADFIARHGIRSVVDLGCGDFQVAQRFLSEGVRYVGVDVVEPLVRHNQAAFGSATVSFACLDITCDPIPDGDLCLVREVLQHLSNEQIAKVLNATRKFRYMIYSDYQPGAGPNCAPNRDIVHGRDTRIWKDSAVFLDQPPFNRQTEILLEVPSEDILRRPGECIRTYLLTDQAPS